MIDNERMARAALSRLMEPQDAAGLALVQAAGAQDALRIASGELQPVPSSSRRSPDSWRTAAPGAAGQD